MAVCVIKLTRALSSAEFEGWLPLLGLSKDPKDAVLAAIVLALLARRGSAIYWSDVATRCGGNIQCAAEAAALAS